MRTRHGERTASHLSEPDMCLGNIDGKGAHQSKMAQKLSAHADDVGLPDLPSHPHLRAVAAIPEHRSATFTDIAACYEYSEA